MYGMYPRTVSSFNFTIEYIETHRTFSSIELKKSVVTRDIFGVVLYYSIVGDFQKLYYRRKYLKFLSLLPAAVLKQSFISPHGREW